MTEYQAIVEGRAVANGTSYVDVHNTVEDALAEGADMTWTTEVDSDCDPIELVIDAESYARLVRRAKACDACSCCTHS